MTSSTENTADYLHRMIFRVAFYLMFIGMLVNSATLINPAFTAVDSLLYFIGIPLVVTGAVVLWTTSPEEKRDLSELAILKYGMVVGALLPVTMMIIHVSTLTTSIGAYTWTMASVLVLVWSAGFAYIHAYINKTIGSSEQNVEKRSHHL
ncbi:hypothetical protein JCM19037_2334 [Geomicrobium sp. JCM 19037]|uniref:hypothetical protein n=1 Tax=Geomicrobium sp. JCM 19037 TaxID=1460634 RepID=UPI00045F3FBB|nr:hypothetical protein [Geomicrobium sp. JCM 19037]GAK03966.1 hypothetical protein JCM19037_2334 [Geomicrobium sp. JCM 19037]